MAAFPVMRTLATIHLYRHFRADQGTYGTPCTFSIIIKDSRQIATGVQFIRDRNNTLGAEGNTKLAPLTQLTGNFNSSFHFSLHFSKLVRISLQLYSQIPVVTSF